MPLTPFDQLGAIEAMVTAWLRRFDGLRVDKRRTRLALASFEDAEVTAQGIVEPFPDAVSPPAPTIGIDDAPGRQIVWHQTPCPARAQDIQDCIDNCPLGIFLGSTARVGSRDQWFKDGPFGIIEISGIGLSRCHAAILPQPTILIPLF